MLRLVSGSCYASGLSEFQNVIVTLQEMDAVESAFENFRTQLNEMSLQHPENSVFPCVFSMMETTIGPMIKDEVDCNVREKREKDFAESVRLTVESIMPWERFQNYATVGVL